MHSRFSGSASHRSLAFQRTPPQLVDAESFLSEGRGRRLFPEKYQSHIQFGDGESRSLATTARLATARASSLPAAGRAASATRRGAEEDIFPPQQHRQETHEQSVRRGEPEKGQESHRTRPQRRPRGPGTAYARYIEAHGFPEAAARRHHGDDVAAREKLRPFYTVQQPNDPGSESTRTAKRIHKIPFGRDRTDAREPLNLFDRQENLRWWVGSDTSITPDVIATEPRRLGDSTPAQSVHQAAPSPELSAPTRLVDDARVQEEDMAKQAMRVAYLQRLLEVETERLLSMTQHVPDSESDEPHDATHESGTTAQLPQRTRSTPRRRRQRQLWERASLVGSASDEESQEDGTQGRQRSACDNTTCERDASSRHVRASREYAMAHTDDASTRTASVPVSFSPPRASSAIRVISRHVASRTPSTARTSSVDAPSPSSSPSSSPQSAHEASTRWRRHDDEDAEAISAHTVPAPSEMHIPTRLTRPTSTPAPLPTPHWKAQLLAKARERDAHGFFARATSKRTELPADDVHNAAGAWSVPFPVASHGPTRRMASPRPAPQQSAAVLPAGRTGTSPTAGRATMRDRRCDPYTSDRGHTRTTTVHPGPSARLDAESILDDTAEESPQQNESLAVRTSAATPPTGRSLLDVLTQAGPRRRGSESRQAARPHVRGTDAEVNRSFVSWNNDSVQSLRDVLEATSGTHRRL